MLISYFVGPIPSAKFPFFSWYFLLEIAEAYLKKVSSVKKNENSYFGGLEFGKWKLRL